MIVVRRPLSAIEAGAKVPERAFARLRDISIFNPLPIVTVENLATRAGTRRVEPGTPIVREGDPAEAFFVIEEGSVDVHEDGVFRRVERAGEFFGEIALLRDSPRAATVRATTLVTLLTFERDDFLAAVGAHPRSSHAAERVAQRRLRALPISPAAK